MRWIVCIVSLGVACGGDDEGTGSASESGSASASASESGSESASDSMTVSVSGSESGTSTSDSGPDTGSTSEVDTTSGPPTSCAEATDVTICMATSDLDDTCRWLAGSTFVGGNGGPCMSIDVGPTGVCALEGQGEGCLTAEASCPDGLTSVWYREVGLEVGAVEVVSFGTTQLCDAPAGFMPCMYDAETATYTPPECSCICPMGE